MVPLWSTPRVNEAPTATSLMARPRGVGVRVKVEVIVGVDVAVNVAVGVDDAVTVAVADGVNVGVEVGPTSTIE